VPELIASSQSGLPTFFAGNRSLGKVICCVSTLFIFGRVKTIIVCGLLSFKDKEYSVIEIAEGLELYDLVLFLA